MPNTILNDPAASVNAAPFAAQARPDKVDVDIWVAAMGGSGVVSGGLVTAHGGTLGVDVTAVVVIINGVQHSVGAATNLTLSAADSTNPRIDIVVTDGSTISVTVGVASAAPCWPNVPAGKVALSMVYVTAAATTLSSSNLVDKRMIATGSSTVRQTATHTTSSLIPNTQELSTIVLANTYRILSVTTSAAARVRLYDRSAKQSPDANRSIGARPSGDHGLTYEFVGSSTLLSMDATPPVIGSSMNATPTSTIPLTVDNLSTSTQAITVTLTFMAME